MVVGGALNLSFSDTSYQVSELQTLRSILVLSPRVWGEVSWESVMCVHAWKL